MKIHRSIKIEKTLIELLDKMAADQNRSFNNLVETLLINSLQNKHDKICQHEFVTTSTLGGRIGGGIDGAICRWCGYRPSAQTINNGYDNDQLFPIEQSIVKL